MGESARMATQSQGPPSLARRDEASRSRPGIARTEWSCGVPRRAAKWKSRRNRTVSSPSPSSSQLQAIDARNPRRRRAPVSCGPSDATPSSFLGSPAQASPSKKRESPMCARSPRSGKAADGRPYRRNQSSRQGPAHAIRKSSHLTVSELTALRERRGLIRRLFPMFYSKCGIMNQS
jgi:hypothetical protein